MLKRCINGKGVKCCIDIIIKFLISIIIIGAFFNIFIRKEALPRNDFNLPMILGVVGLSIVFISIFYIFIDKNKLSPKVKKRLKIVLSILLIIVQIIYVLCLYRNIGWDCGIVHFGAMQLVEGGFEYSDYFATSGNNVFLLLLFEILYRIAKLFNVTNYLLISVLFNVIMIDIAIVYINLVSKKLIGKFGYLNLAFTIPILAITPYLIIAYSDTISLLFPIGIFYYYLRLKDEDSNKMKCVILISILTILGILIKPTNIIINIAILIIEGINFIFDRVNNKKKINIKYYLKFIIVAIGVIGTIYLLFSLYKGIRLRNYISKQQIEDSSFTMAHFCMMGLKPVDYEGEYYGMFNMDDVIATKSHIGKDEKNKFNIEQIKLRISNLGFAGYLDYLYGKFNFIMSDGTFFYGKEGGFYQSEPYIKGEFADFIQQYVYGNKYKTITVNVMQGVWISCLLFVGVGAIINLLKKDDEKLNILRLSFVGIVLFILIFEARSRYLYNYLPILILLATTGCYDLIKHISKYNKKEKILMLKK